MPVVAEFSSKVVSICILIFWMLHETYSRLTDNFRTMLTF
jgi:hypothetical protein